MDPSATGDMRQYLRGVGYPASREEVASAAEDKGAPGDFVDRIRGASNERFGNPDEVMVAVRGSADERREL